MTVQTLAVLKVLLERAVDEHYGLEVAKSAGLLPGSIYPILARLEQAAWLESKWEDMDPVAEGRPRRRYYRLTTHGAQQAREALWTAQRAVTPHWGHPPGPANPGGAPA